MKLHFSFILFVFIPYLFIAQEKSHFNLAFGFGPSYFFNDNSLQRRIDRSATAGVNYELISKKLNIRFNPGLGFQASNFRFNLDKNRLVHVDQHTFNLNLDVLMKLRKKLYLRVGLLFTKVFLTETSISQLDLNRNSRYYYGSSEISQHYHPSNFQSGYTLGLSMPFKLFKREQKFNIKFIHMVTPLVKSDYNLPKALIGEDMKVLSNKARPFMLTLGFDISLEHRKKKEKLKEEEE